MTQQTSEIDFPSQKNATIFSRHGVIGGENEVFMLSELLFPIDIRKKSCPKLLGDFFQCECDQSIAKADLIGAASFHSQLLIV